MVGAFLPASFTPGATASGDRGQLAHPEAIAHTRRLQRRVYAVGDDAWCVVGNGLSNQTFVRGPQGLIVIDTGECIEEMQAALAEVRRLTDAPVAACIYTHFHYVGGTRALLGETGGAAIPIYGHSGIAANLRRFAGAVGPRYARGLVHQFGVMLPSEGPDALENVGLGLHFRNPDHAPFTHGYLPADHSFDESLSTRIAGLDVVMTHAPSDATDSITIWFPELELAVNNLLWPGLFNVFAIRGEEYRDPRVVIDGLDQLAALPTAHLVGTHGPPLSGRDQIQAVLTDYRDAIQFIWDQTVRGANKGLAIDELIQFVQLPQRFDRDYHTRQLYGLVEHHVRQIYSGLCGWFDENPANLFPMPPVERCVRLIAGFGGIERVREQLDAAIASGDYRWALELASWLVRSETGPDGRADGGAPEDRGRLAAVLREIGRCTLSANVRNWCLTRALELEGTIDLGRFRAHRVRPADVVNGGPATSIEMLRVLLDPIRAADLDDALAWHFHQGATVALRVRRGVAVPAAPDAASGGLRLSLETWSELLGGRLSLDDALSRDKVQIHGSEERVRRFLSVFDVPGLSS